MSPTRGDCNSSLCLSLHARFETRGEAAARLENMFNEPNKQSVNSYVPMDERVVSSKTLVDETEQPDIEPYERTQNRYGFHAEHSGRSNLIERVLVAKTRFEIDMVFKFVFVCSDSRICLSLVFCTFLNRPFARCSRICLTLAFVQSILAVRLTNC